MNHNVIVTLVVAGIAYGTPLLIAGLGELLTERSGVLNLGIEGMMLVGAATAFWVSKVVGGPAWFALLVAAAAAMASGAAMALVFAVVCITFRANQVVTGLALAIFGGSIGLSSYLASSGKLTKAAGPHQIRALNVLGLKGLPIVGPILFHEDVVVYASWALVVLVALYLYTTRLGLHLRAVGEQPQAADSMGISVTLYRYTHTVVGGAFAGAAGAYYSLALTPSWSNGLTAGAGWIALGLVIFAFWRPGLLMAGAYLFGIVTSLGFTLQARGVTLPPELFAALPYVMTVIVLVLTSSILSGRRLGSPAALAQFYEREEH